ncbi:MAG: FecR domain-containing protein [Candidatus Omnitrophica bacterium]|nr:FecR domain-containing protein [Candidatus Omnitrophota bacterium]
MKKIFITSIFLSTLVYLFIMPLSSAQAAGNINIATDDAVILFKDGTVKVKPAAENDWVDAEKGMKLSSNDRLKTIEDSWAELGLGKGYLNVLRIEENTIVELTGISPAQVNLMQGELRALVENLDKDETFEIKTPMSVCGVRGTGWDTSYDGSKVIVDVFENDVFFAAISKKGEPISDPVINSGKRGILTDPIKPINIVNVPGGKKRDWLKWKEGYLQRRGLQKGPGGGANNLQNKVSDLKDTSNDMLKGKEGIFERKDQNNIDNRTDDNSNQGVGYP